MAAPAAMAQAFSKADSGWVPLFDGKSFDGLHSRLPGGEIADLPDQAVSIDSGTIRITPVPGREQVHIGTDRKFTHYRSRVEYRFEGTGGRAGFSYHVDESRLRHQDGRPRSIECGMLPGDDAGRAYSIAMAIFTTKATNGRFHADGTVVDACEVSSGELCDAQDYGAGGSLVKPGAWNRLEVVVRGSDSALHRVNDSTVLRLWNIRVPTDSQAAYFAPHGSGSLAMRVEGAGLQFRNWEIMELPTDGPSIRQRLFLTNTQGGERLVPGGSHVITWRTLGEVRKVSLFWHAGDGAWEMMADNIANTGYFAWSVPMTPTGTLRVKITAAPWVAGDSSAADNSIGPAASLRPRPGAASRRTTAMSHRDVAGRFRGDMVGRLRERRDPVHAYPGRP